MPGRNRERRFGATRRIRISCRMSAATRRVRAKLNCRESSARPTIGTLMLTSLSIRKKLFGSFAVIVFVIAALLAVVYGSFTRLASANAADII